MRLAIPTILSLATTILSSTASIAQAAALDERFYLYTTLPNESIQGANPTTTSAAATATASSTVHNANSQAILTPPTPPGGQPSSIAWQLWESTDALVASGNNISVNQRGNFLGFSVELSVSNQIFGDSSQLLNVPFLNYMANIRARAGQGPRIRVGGNSQELSVLYAGGLPSDPLDTDVDDKKTFLRKFTGGVDNPTNTPEVDYSPDLIYAMANISSLVGAQFYFGLAFADPSNQTNANQVSQFVSNTLGSNLVGLQVSNEPDLYAGRRRADTYSVTDYITELGTFFTNLDAYDATASQATLHDFLLPSVCCNWSPDYMVQAGLLTTFATRMKALSFQHYPNNNCYGTVTAQDVFSDYLNHTSATSLIQDYVETTQTAVEMGLEVQMLETNTASCSGFEGLSDSFGSALWAVDWALTLAYRNFTTALLHVGGRSAFYNPFTAPMANQTSFRQWTTGPIYYTTLIVAEALGSSNASQVIDISRNSTTLAGSTDYFPAYAVYENNAPQRVVLINFISDATGASDYTAQVSVGTALQSVQVRYFQAPSVAEQYDITWANQTLGGQYASDGRLYGTQSTLTIPCTNGVCPVPVYAPSIALVFLTDSALSESTPTAAQSTATFATTAATGVATDVLPASAMATSNGRGGVSGSGMLGSTSPGGAKSNTAVRRDGGGALATVAGAVVGGVILAMV